MSQNIHSCVGNHLEWLPRASNPEVTQALPASPFLTPALPATASASRAANLLPHLLLDELTYKSSGL